MVQKRSYSVVVITPDFESGNLSSNLGKTYLKTKWYKRSATGPITRGCQKNDPSFRCAFLAQSVERVAVNHKVSGSIPEGSVCVIAQCKLFGLYCFFDE